MAAEKKPKQDPQVRHVSGALPPPMEVGGRGPFAPYRPEPTQVPDYPPMYFPSDLWPQANMILLDASKKLPLRTQIRELCKHVIAEMVPVFVGAVTAGRMTASAVLTEGLGGMADLLYSLLIYNDYGSRSGFPGLSDEGYRLEQEARKSEEWLSLAKAIAEAGHLRTGTKQTQTSLAQNSGKTAQHARRKSVSPRRPRARTERRAQTVSKLLEELRTVTPKIHNESHYPKVEREHPRYLLFKIAREDSDVKRWIENVQDRRGLVGLAQEIAARRFKVAPSTIKTDWTHRRKPRRSSKKRR